MLRKKTGVAPKERAWLCHRRHCCWCEHSCNSCGMRVPRTHEQLLLLGGVGKEVDMKKRAQLTLPGLEHAASTSRDRLPTSPSCRCQCRAGSRGLCRPQLPHRRRKASSQQKGRCKRKARRKCPRRGCACFEDHLLYDHGHVAGRAFWRKGRRGEHGNRLAQSERQSVMRGIFVRLLLFGWICIFSFFDGATTIGLHLRSRSTTRTSRLVAFYDLVRAERNRAGEITTSHSCLCNFISNIDCLILQMLLRANISALQGILGNSRIGKLRLVG